MTKVDAMRAMREAKHARGGAPPDPPGAAGARTANPAPQRTSTPRQADVPADGPADEELCGHRNMGGKTCSRPAGHSEKNHRYR